MASDDKKVVKVGPRLAKYIGAKATREKRLQAANMQAEFTLLDTLIMLCYLGRDPDKEIAEAARKNLIPAARAWFSRPDKPELPEPIHEIVIKVLERVGVGDQAEAAAEGGKIVRGNIGLLGLGEIIQAIDHNNRTAVINLRTDGEDARIFAEHGKVVGAVAGDDDGLEALYRAFGWGDADFTYILGETGPFTNRIKVNTLTLVMDALERAPDEDPFDSEASLSWRVEGNLRVLNVFEIAEIFEMNSKQALCNLIREEGSGTLYFNQGRIVNAALGELTGMDAACHLLAWPNARFVISRGRESVAEEIHIGMQNLIIEAMRLLDEGVTVTDRIATELQLINELFEGQSVVALPVLDKVRLVFGEDEQAREILETDLNPVVRKAVKVKISKTIYKYLQATTDHPTKLKAAQGLVPLSTTEKLVLLSYLSHDESQEIRDQARKTLETLDAVTYRKGIGADLHPAVMDFLVRETIREESLIKAACATPGILPETAIHVLDQWKGEEVLRVILENTKLLERSPAVVAKLTEALEPHPEFKRKVEIFEESLLEGSGDIKVEGPLAMCGLSGLMHAAEHAARSGTIVLDGSKKRGRIFFRKGKLVGAVSGSLEGKEALEDLLQARDLRFRYLLRTYRHTENVDLPTAENLLATNAARPFLDPESKSGLHLLSGSTHAMDVFDALACMEGTPATIKVTVLCEEGSGEIFRDRSRVLHVAVRGKDDPYTAMAAILSWNATRFIIRYATEEFPTTVDKTLSEFVIECIKEVPEELSQIPRPGELPQWELSEAEYQSLYHQILEMGVAEKIKLALMGNQEARNILVRDPNKLVAVAVVKSPKIQDKEIDSISKSRSVHDDVLRYISGTKELVKLYSVKFNLAGNPKTPVPIALKLLSHLRELDLRKSAKSKDVPQVVATHARRLADVKTSG